MAGGENGRISENPLFVSWVDSAWIPVLNQANVMDYFRYYTIHSSVINCSSY